MPALILASGSATRARLLRAAGLAFEVERPRVDEESLTAALLADGVSPRGVADGLAEMKAARVAARRPDALVLGGDQVAEVDGRLLPPLAAVAEIRPRLEMLAGRMHVLHSAAVLFEGGEPAWRHVAAARVTMGRPSAAFLDGYVQRHGERLLGSAVPYRIEEEGVRLVERVDGDHFTVLGLPLLPLLAFLGGRGSIPA